MKPQTRKVIILSLITGLFLVFWMLRSLFFERTNLVYLKEYAYYKAAINAERKIKAYSKERKEELVKVYENR
jgi:hypothetical protein